MALDMPPGLSRTKPEVCPLDQPRYTREEPLVRTSQQQLRPDIGHLASFLQKTTRNDFHRASCALAVIFCPIVSYNNSNINNELHGLQFPARQDGASCHQIMELLPPES